MILWYIQENPFYLLMALLGKRKIAQHFDVTMDSFDGAEMCKMELTMFLLHQLEKVIQL